MCTFINYLHEHHTFLRHLSPCHFFCFAFIPPSCTCFGLWKSFPPNIWLFGLVGFFHHLTPFMDLLCIVSFSLLDLPVLCQRRFVKMRPNENQRCCYLSLSECLSPSKPKVIRLVPIRRCGRVRIRRKATSCYCSGRVEHRSGLSDVGAVSVGPVTS